MADPSPTRLEETQAPLPETQAMYDAMAAKVRADQEAIRRYWESPRPAAEVATALRECADWIEHGRWFSPRPGLLRQAAALIFPEDGA